MTPPLPAIFSRLPLAHRGLHDKGAGRPENSLAAFQAAIDHGYAIEMDLQLTADGRAVVFHDYDTKRLIGKPGPIRQITTKALEACRLLGGVDERIPTFAETLDFVAGRVPLLIELKDQDGNMGPGIGTLEADVAATLKQYIGPAAVMSFNPHSVAELARLLPDIPRGIVTSDYVKEDWPLSRTRCDELREIPDFDRVGASFISHEARDLDRPRVQELRRKGAPVLCYTIRSPQAEARARALADNITFEGYLAKIPA